MHYDDFTAGIVTFTLVAIALTSFSTYYCRKTQVFRRFWRVCSAIFLAEILNSVLACFGCLTGTGWPIPIGLLLLGGILCLAMLGLMHSIRSYHFKSYLGQRQYQQLTVDKE